MSRGIDYSPTGSTVNRDPETGIRYGVIPMGCLGEFAHESFEARYDERCPHCGYDLLAHRGEQVEEVRTTDGMRLKCPECEKLFRDDDRYGDEPSAQECDDGEYRARLDDSNDVWFFKSPYFTRAAFCSPCAPGACYLTSPCDDGERAYCPGPDWFDESNPAPYPIYSVASGELVNQHSTEPPSHEQDGPASARDMFPSDCPDRD